MHISYGINSKPKSSIRGLDILYTNDVIVWLIRREFYIISNTYQVNKQGHTTGDFTIQISSLGNIPFQTAFKSSPCFNQRPSSAAIDVNNLDAVALITKAY